MVEVQEVRTSPLYVKKFGGTSVGSVERIEVIAEQIANSFHKGERQVIVLSAMERQTNHLFSLANQIDAQPDPRELDMLVSTGEQISIALMAMALQKRGLKARSLTGDQVQIHTNNQFGRASIESVDTDYLTALLRQDIVPIVAGFQGRNHQAEVTTLGRGGSDTTAVALAAALGADECHIYTDVAGIFTTDPNIEPSAQKLEAISFGEMFEMARLGAKVLHPDSVAYAERFDVALRVLSSFEQGEGTLIQLAKANKTRAQVIGIAVSNTQSLISLPSIQQGSDGYAQVFQLLMQHGIDSDLFTKTQASTDTVSFMLEQANLDRALAALDTMACQLNLGSIHCERQVAKVSLVGGAVFAKNEVAAKIFETFEALDIEVKLIASSEIKLSIVISQDQLHCAVRGLHHAFGLNKR